MKTARPKGHVVTSGHGMLFAAGVRDRDVGFRLSMEAAVTFGLLLSG